MENLYVNFLQLEVKGCHIGLEQDEKETTYFCTPSGANIMGWAGVDGIHFCFVRGFCEVVFAVSPMNAPCSYVHPVARNFEDFIRLLLACSHTVALEQAWCLEQEQFDKYLLDNTPTKEQIEVLQVLREKMHLEPMEKPFTYMQDLQNGFDYRTIPYSKEYYDIVPDERYFPEWKVYYDGSFWEYSERKGEGKEIPVNKEFIWGGEVWTIPAIYTCGQGLVVDFYLKISSEQIYTFMDKWNLSENSDMSGLTSEKRMQIDAENPLNVHINPKLMLNGTEILSSQGCGTCWNPCFPMGNGLEIRNVMLHYELDPEQGYVVWRGSFPWKTKRKPLIKSLSIILMERYGDIPGPHFVATIPGEQMVFMHPATGERHVLTIQGLERQELSTEIFNDTELEFPKHFTTVNYTLTPDLTDQAVTVTDCTRGDQPRRKHIDPRMAHSTGDVGLSIIGRADGPTMIALGNGSLGKQRSVCSVLHFKPVDRVELRIVFHEKTHTDITVGVI